MSTVTPAAHAARQELTGFGGRLIGPEDVDYDEARQVYNAMIDKRPALIARCKSPDDVADTVAFARERGLRIAIRGGGHNGAGLGTVDAGVVIDLSLLKDIEVDPKARTVRVGGGCTWGEVDSATGEHGLATPSGIISTTGVGGLTLGGGIGHLTPQVRAHDRQPARGRRRARKRRARARERRRASRPLLGAPGRRRQLRRRHVVPLPPARGGHHLRRPDVLAGRGRRRGALRVPRVPPSRAARAERLLRLPHRAAGPAVPGGDPPAQGVRCGLVLRRVGEGRREGDGSVPRVGPRAADARCRRRCRTRRCRARSTGSIRRATSGTGAPTSSRRSPTRR